MVANTTDVSIALATYNGAEFLEAQLESFLEQTRPPDEVVICDDSSSDGTWAVLQRFQRSACFTVRLERNETRLGYVKNFEKAICLCSGDVIFLSDQDDKWFPHKIETMLKILEQEPQTWLVISDMVVATADLEPASVTQLGNILAAGQSPDEMRAGCCMAFRATLREVILPIPGPSSIKHDFWINALALTLKVRKLLPEPLHLYRRHGENASQSVLSRPVRVHPLQYGIVVASQKNFRAAKETELENLSILKRRLLDRSEILAAMGMNDRQAEALAGIDQKAAFLTRRVSLFRQPRWRRLSGICALWWDRGYEGFSGWRSAFMDALRP